MIKKNQIFFFLLLLFSLFFYANSFVLPVHAETEPLLTSDIIAAAECKDGCSISVFMKVVIQAAKIILGLVGSLTLLMFVYGGFMLLVSAGNTERIQKGKDILLGSIVGLLIVFGSYIFINFVINDLLGAQGDFKFTGSSSVETGGAGASTQKRADQKCLDQGGTCMEPTQCLNRPGGWINGVGVAYCGSANKSCCMMIANKCEESGAYICKMGLNCGDQVEITAFSAFCGSGNRCCTKPPENPPGTGNEG